MRITELLKKEAIALNVRVDSKEAYVFGTPLQWEAMM